MDPVNWLIAHDAKGFYAREIVGVCKHPDGTYSYNVRPIPGTYSSIILAFNAIQMRIRQQVTVKR